MDFKTGMLVMLVGIAIVGIIAGSVSASVHECCKITADPAGETCHQGYGTAYCYYGYWCGPYDGYGSGENSLGGTYHVDVGCTGDYMKIWSTVYTNNDASVSWTCG